MADAKQLRALKITSKHGTEAQWAALEPPYIPNSGEIIVFDADSNFIEPRIKVGDGVSSATELPFVGASEIYIGTKQPAVTHRFGFLPCSFCSEWAASVVSAQVEVFMTVL